jgi:hypothetical protein
MINFSQFDSVQLRKQEVLLANGKENGQIIDRKEANERIITHKKSRLRMNTRLNNKKKTENIIVLFRASVDNRRNK